MFKKIAITIVLCLSLAGLAYAAKSEECRGANGQWRPCSSCAKKCEVGKSKPFGASCIPLDRQCRKTTSETTACSVTRTKN